MKSCKAKLFRLAVLIIVTMQVIGTTSDSYGKTLPDPTEQLRPLVEQVVVILTDPELQGTEKCFDRREKVMKAVHERFDFYEMSKRVLGSQWRKISSKEKEDFVKLFTTLLEHAYIGKIENYSKQKVEFKDQRIKKNRAEVKTLIIDNEVVIPVSYVMILKGEQWKVYDIVVEGVSLVRNYMEQFREILRKDSYEALVVQLRDKVAELEMATKPCPLSLSKGS